MENVNVPSGSTKTPSYGEKAVGLTFNPSGDVTVQKVKELYASIIDICKPLLDAEPTYGVSGDMDMKVFSERGQLFVEAIRQAQTAQMWAVKALTYKN